MKTQTADVVVIGTGPGGATTSAELTKAGYKVIIVERGPFLPQTSANRLGREVVRPDGKYSKESPWVGGRTKHYGAALFRFRPSDFAAVSHPDGESPAWPMTYEEMEPYYQRAEEQYFVHGPNDEPLVTAPRSADYPFPKVEHDPHIAEIAARFARCGATPGHIPLGLDIRDGGRCTPCGTCDAYPCPTHGKADAEVCGVHPALDSGNAKIITNATCKRLVTSPDGTRVVAAEVHEADSPLPLRLEAKIFVVAAGAVGSAALLLMSTDKNHDQGLGNSSGQVGKNLMGHLVSTLTLTSRLRLNPPSQEKTLAILDFYDPGDHSTYPLGSVQNTGQMPLRELVSGPLRIPAALVERRVVSLLLMSEDLPHPTNCVELTADGLVRVDFGISTGVSTHNRLRDIMTEIITRGGLRILPRSGFPRTPEAAAKRRVVRTGDTTTVTGPCHACGTLRAGTDPSTSVLSIFCRSHDVANLYCVDGSFLPSSAAVNPALTIVAQALRVSDHIIETGGVDG